jgi:tetratricopeptide (TPR) repeat protein
MALSLVFFFYEIALGNLRRNWKKTISYFAVGFFCLVFFAVQFSQRLTSVGEMNYQQIAVDNPLLQLPVAITSYLILIFWPQKLTFYHTEMGFTVPEYVVYLIVFLFFVSLLIWSWRNNRLVFFWLFFFVAALSPTLTPYPISWLVAERYAYLGSLGIIVVFSVFAARFLEKENIKQAAIVFLTALITILAARNVIRQNDWKNEDVFWLATEKYSPSGHMIHYLVGDVYSRRGDFERAIGEFETAIAINPSFADAYYGMALTYAKMDDVDNTLKNLLITVKLNPRLWQPMANLAAIYYNWGNFENANIFIQKALEIDPGNKLLEGYKAKIEEGRKNPLPIGLPEP